MEHVILRIDDSGTYSDPDAYLAVLPELAPRLPPGARAFATEADHYDFFGTRCVKDLKPAEAHADGDRLELRFQHSCFKHDADLLLRYTGVTAFTTDPPGALPSDVLLDELLPDGGGIRHEIGCCTGTILVLAADVVAEWVPTDCRG